MHVLQSSVETKTISISQSRSKMCAFLPNACANECATVRQHVARATHHLDHNQALALMPHREKFSPASVHSTQIKVAYVCVLIDAFSQMRGPRRMLSFVNGQVPTASLNAKTYCSIAYPVDIGKSRDKHMLRDQSPASGAQKTGTHIICKAFPAHAPRHLTHTAAALLYICVIRFATPIF